MPARLAKSAAPTNALTFWTDGYDLYTELPGPGDGCSVLRYPLTSAGLQSALGIIRTKARFDGAYIETEATKVEAAKQFLRALGDTRV